MLSVRVSNHPQDTVDSLPSGAGKQLYRLYGGIYRKAWLVKTRSAHFDPLDHGSSGVYVTPSNVTPDAADLAVRARVRNASAGARALRFVARLVDADGREVATERQELDVPPGQVAEARVQRRLASPRLWSPEVATSVHAARGAVGGRPRGRCAHRAHGLPRFPACGTAGSS